MALLGVQLFVPHMVLASTAVGRLRWDEAVAHADAGSRDQDALARGGTPVTPADLFGPALPPTGGPR